VVTSEAGWKVVPHLGIVNELVDSLIFEGLPVLQSQR